MTGRAAAALKSTRIGDRFIRRNPFYYGRAVALFDRLEASSLEARRAYTHRRLKTVLAAASGTAYGRSVGMPRELRDWPLLEKERIRDDPAAFTLNRRLVGRASTSGTTGVPLELVRSPQSIAVEQAAIDRVARARGVNLAKVRLAVLRGDDIAPAERTGDHWRDSAGGRRRVFAANELDAQTLASFAGGLEEFAPACVFAYPTVLESLCRLLEESGRRLSVGLTITSSEMLTGTTRSLAERVR